jgi:hypothetical protein
MTGAQNIEQINPPLGDMTLIVDNGGKPSSNRIYKNRFDWSVLNKLIKQQQA